MGGTKNKTQKIDIKLSNLSSQGRTADSVWLLLKTRAAHPEPRELPAGPRLPKAQSHRPGWPAGQQDLGAPGGPPPSARFQLLRLKPSVPTCGPLPPPSHMHATFDLRPLEGWLPPPPGPVMLSLLGDNVWD